MPADDFLSVDEAAEVLGLHPETVRERARQGCVPAFKTGRKWRFSLDHLNRWISAQSAGRVPPRILAVDDESRILDLYRITLQGAGLKVETVSDGAQAIALLGGDLPDLIILDLKMPGGTDGLDVMRHARNRSRDLPVIVVTGYPESHLLQEALAYTPLLVFAKPLRQEDLLQAVKRCLGIQKYEASARTPGVSVLSEEHEAVRK